MTSFIQDNSVKIARTATRKYDIFVARCIALLYLEERMCARTQCNIQSEVSCLANFNWNAEIKTPRYIHMGCITGFLV